MPAKKYKKAEFKMITVLFIHKMYILSGLIFFKCSVLSNTVSLEKSFRAMLVHGDFVVFSLIT